MNRLLAIIAMLLLPHMAVAQTVPNPQAPIGAGIVWNPAQWISAFQAKADVNNGTLNNPTINGGTLAGLNVSISGASVTGALGYTPLNKAGDIMGGPSLQGSAITPGSPGSLQIGVPSSYGTAALAVGLSAMSNCFQLVPQAGGSQSVGFFAENCDRQPLVTASSPTYDATHVFTTLSSVQQEAIRIGSDVLTNDTTPEWGTITAVSGSGVTLSGGWFLKGTTTAAGVPTGSAAYLDAFSTPFAFNTVTQCNGYVTTPTCIGGEIDLNNLGTNAVVSNIYTTAGDSGQGGNGLQIVGIGNQNQNGLLINGPFNRGVLVRQAATAGFIWGQSNGTGFLSGQTSGNAFEIRDPTSGATTASITAPSTLALGMQSGGTANIPHINFYSSANSSPDATINVQGGGTQNTGSMRISAQNLWVAYGASGTGDTANISGSSAAGSGVTYGTLITNNTPIYLQSNGTGAVRIQNLQNPYTAPIANFIPPIVTGNSQTNYLQVTASLTGSPVLVAPTGVDANAAMTVRASGSGTLTLGGGSNVVAVNGGVSCAANTVSLTTLVVTNGIVTHC